MALSIVERFAPSEDMLADPAALVPDEALAYDLAAPDLGDADGIYAAAALLSGQEPQHAPADPSEWPPPEIADQMFGKVWTPPAPLTAAALPAFNGRTLHYVPRPHRMYGRDVLAVEMTLRQLHLRAQDPSMFFGRYARDQVKSFQRRVGLAADGAYGSRSHTQLRPHFGAYARWLYNNQRKPAVVARTPAEKFTHALWYLYAHRPWAYHAVRPFRLYRYGQAITYAYDCSWLVTEAAFLAGLADPNGVGYQGGYGNTETLRVHGTAVSTPTLGCMIFYGYYGSSSDPAHVAAYVGNGQCIGFGSSGGPRLLPINYRTIRQFRRYY